MHHRLRNLLGFAGLIPFVSFTLLSAISYSQHTAVLLLISYGAIILSFMAGSLWGQAQHDTHSRAGPLIASNALALSGWAALYCAVTGWALLALMGLALAFISCWCCERVWLQQEPDYQRLRGVLTSIVVLCLAATSAIVKAN
ncbi:DUF3429 domain-containing protein [Gilvimarinus algae]|uniref:DUF3429 domain-containing protein n=1 Tax=Gilvimarinus algae TaxID=3058037 RepID=A0ABT8TH32_9GAMM|nr:DUF3429 domain-containing protein [Gilvimarinus sp. SDUM040014]MDO3383310.1 DUF3429 domain-containing protein [Gilvimarinus sp. SDUM040014]